jgi:ribose transport system substrate-binding protein
MKSRSRTATGLAALLAAAVVLAGCSSSGKATTNAAENGATSSGTSSGTSSEPYVAIVQTNYTDPYAITLVCGAQTEAQKLGVRYRLFTAPLADAASAAAAVSAALLSHPKGLLLNNGIPTQFASQVKTLMQQGVPVVTWGPLEPSTQYMDELPDTTGTALGALLAKQFVASLGSTSGTVAVLGGQAGDAVENERWQPMVAALKAADPNIKVLPEQFDSYDISKGTSIVSSLLLGNPNLKAIIAVAGPETTAAAAAIQEAGKVGKVKVWGFDAPPAAIAALKRGIVAALATPPPFTRGVLQMQALAAYVKSHPNGGPVQPSSNGPHSHVAVLTQANVNSPAMQAYISKSTCSV